ncbi:Plug domain-containing protein, partial [Corallococcus praedator]
YRLTGGNTAMLQRVSATAPGARQLDPVQVQGNAVPPQATIDNLPPAYAGEQVATGGQVGILGERSFRNTPFNQTSYTSDLMRNQNARTLADVVANDPSVRYAWSASSYTTPLVIRGFNFNNNDVSFN